MMTFKDRTVIFDGPKIMGILNVTPDSFSDGGKFNQLETALSHAQDMIAHGATFIDVGGESSRPGGTSVSLSEELDRVIPIISALCARFDVIVSVDTSKAEVMREAANHGASLINDVRALSEPGALAVAAELAINHNIPSCIMHMQGTPQTMQHAPSYCSVVDEVTGFFSEQIKRLMKAGFAYNQIMLDPGFGFGKTLDHNYEMLKYFTQFTQFDLPVLAGMSRKSMVSKLLRVGVDKTQAGDISVNTIAALSGASVLRVHDVKEAMDVATIIEKLNQLN